MHIYIEFINEIKINNRKIIDDLNNKVLQGYNCKYYTDEGETIWSDETMTNINLVRFEKNRHHRIQIYNTGMSLYYNNLILSLKNPDATSFVATIMDNIMQYYKGLGLIIDNIKIPIQYSESVADKLYPCKAFMENGYSFTSDVDLGYHFRVSKDNCTYVFDMESIYKKGLIDISEMKCNIFMERKTNSIQDPLLVKQFILDTPNEFNKFKSVLLQK